MTVQDFDDIPVLDLSLANDPTKKPAFLQTLRHILFHIGFLYISNTGVSPTAVSDLKAMILKFFALPQSEKEKLSFLNSPHFLGYNALGSETTAQKTDLREQFEFSNDLDEECQDRLSYMRLRGPSQWPAEDVLPGFQKVMTTYHNEITALSYRFVRLVAEALGLHPMAFDPLFTGNPQHRVKVVRYPPSTKSDQGVGPHKDSSGWWTFLLQADDQPGLQVLNHRGEWIPAPPIEGTFVVNIGQAFEVATEGRCPATIHRVESPQNGKERFSVPFFQGIDLGVGVEDLRGLVRGAGWDETVHDESVVETPFATGKYKWGENQIRTKISHKDVGQKFYPELYEKYVIREE